MIMSHMLEKYVKVFIHWKMKLKILVWGNIIFQIKKHSNPLEAFKNSNISQWRRINTELSVNTHINVNTPRIDQRRGQIKLVESFLLIQIRSSKSLWWFQNILIRFMIYEFIIYSYKLMIKATLHKNTYHVISPSFSCRIRLHLI